MNTPITEKDYPIQLIWVFKYMIVFVCLGALVGLLGLSFITIIANALQFGFYGLINLVYMYLAWRSFHYTLGATELVITQGIVSRKQRSTAYSVIQNVVVSQSLLDRIFGIASVQIQNATQGKGESTYHKLALGSYGNAIIIPGLTVANANTIKTLLLERIQKNPSETTSGL